ncbi:MAG: beta-galactosidase [bacterium]|nr:beta-galactosidase [bacterium]
MYLGVDYYPEQWDIEMIESDLDTMLELGCNVIRIGEFAWHLMEKTEGAYDFSFFDHVIEKAKEKGLDVIFGTPTATMPAWLAKKYPETISEFENGQKRAFGGRHVYCFNSSIFWDYSEKIIRELVNHYKDEDAIVAWQIDNEFGHEGSDECYCKNCQDAFQTFLSKKFGGNIEQLNQTYGTAFWSQEYNEFDEIPTPMQTITTHNPSLRLDWERFRSESIVRYAKFQTDLIKEINGDAVVIHDFPGGGLTKHVDYSEIAKDLDVVAYNNYPVWGGQKEPIKPHEIAFGLDYIRGLKKQNFWITEAIMGAQGHDVTGYLPRPNQAKLWSYQGVARGCDSLMYFRYRGATKGAEQFCYGILDADNKKRRKFYEVQSFFADVKNHEDVLEAPMKSDVCIIYDYDSLASFRIQTQSILLQCEEEMKRLYKPFYDRNITVDVIPSSADFSDYKVVMIPVMIIQTKEFREKMEEYVKNGGRLVMTYRTAVKDQDNNLTLNEELPVGYTNLAGLYVCETESLQEEASLSLVGQGRYEGRQGKAGVFRDMIVATTAEILYSYGDTFYQEFAAVTKNKYYDGEVYYIGCAPEEEVVGTIIEEIIKEVSLTGIHSPDGVEVVERMNGEEKVRILMNHNESQVEFDRLILEPFQCMIQTVK